MGKAGKVKLVSYDALPEEAQDSRDGLSENSIAQAPYMMGYMGMQLLVNYLESF